ncbi:MAG: hypothetical protein GQ535_11100 [Rhodobacteraceae bacterium]|nr:hypothetical protein [Paracoccaceae bacterium]
MDNMKIKKVRLTPEAEVEMVPAKTIGLFGGNLPFVLVRIDGSKVVKLYMGQVIPVGQMCRVINPFQRTLDVQIVLNAPVNFASEFRGIDKSDPRAIKYYLAVRYPSIVNGLNRGTVLFQTKGSSYIDIQYATNVNIEIVRDFGAEALAAIPASGPNIVGKVLHPDGSENNRVLAMQGYFEDLDFNPWLRHDGRPDWPTVIGREASGWSGMLEEGSALLMRGGIDKYYEVNAAVIDCGVDSYDE